MLNVVLFSLIGGLVSLLGASFLFRSKKRADKLVGHATPFAAGVLLATAFVDLLPDALHEKSESVQDNVLLLVLLGILGFFMLERFLRFFHHHHDHSHGDKTPSSLVIIGDTLHNALDGIAIGAAFLIDTPTGVIAATAVALHEIPQEIGDFGLLLRNGMQKRKVVIVNVVSALATMVTAILTFQFAGDGSFPDEYLLAITAGFFIYIATSDIIPEIHEHVAKGRRDIRPWLLLAGALLIVVASPIAHDYIDADHDNSLSTGDARLHEEENLNCVTYYDKDGSEVIFETCEARK